MEEKCAGLYLGCSRLPGWPQRTELRNGINQGINNGSMKRLAFDAKQKKMWTRSSR